MKKALAGMVAAMLMAAPAYAGGGKYHDKQKHEQTQSGQTTQPDSSIGGSDQASDAPAEQQLSGRVVKVAGNSIFIEHMGAVVPFELSKKTQFEGEAKSRKDIKEGAQITASFKVKNNVRNVVTSISTGESGVGGSGEPMDRSGTGGEQREMIDEPTQLPREDAPQPIY